MSLAAAAAQPQSARAADDYDELASCVCLPGRDDVCSSPIATTTLNPNGYGPVGNSRPPAKAPPIDCFYVYPTVSRDEGMNSDLQIAEERLAVESQFARFAGVCRTFA